MRISLPAALVAVCLAVPASAAPITQDFTITASGFFDLVGTSTPPADPVRLQLRLTFDPAAGDQFNNANGLVLLSSTVTIARPLAFDYDRASDVLTFGANGDSTSITAGTNDVLAQVGQAYRGRASFEGLEYSTAATTGIYLSSAGTATVPEPGTILLVLGGLATLGVARRR